MRKYWYYTYQTSNSTGCGARYSDDGEFDVVAVINYLSESYNMDVSSIIITNWKEISSSLYEKLCEHFSSMRSDQ